jgi:hypothetical protein
MPPVENDTRYDRPAVSAAAVGSTSASPPTSAAHPTVKLAATTTPVSKQQHDDALRMNPPPSCGTGHRGDYGTGTNVVDSIDIYRRSSISIADIDSGRDIDRGRRHAAIG